MISFGGCFELFSKYTKYSPEKSKDVETIAIMIIVSRFFSDGLGLVFFLHSFHHNCDKTASQMNHHLEVTKPDEK